MEKTKQINLKISKNLADAAERYAKQYGYRNIQELATDSMREKIFEDDEYDNSFTEKEIELIDAIITKSIKDKDFISEEELFANMKK